MTTHVLIERPQPTRTYRWAVLLAMSVAVYGSYYAFDCIGPLAPLLSRQLHFSDSDIGLLQAVYSFPNIVMVLIGGIIIDRIGTKKSVFLFACVCFAGIVVTALSPSLAVMATGRLVFGVGAESLAIAVTTAAARWFRGKELAFAFGITGTIERFGSLSAQTSPAWAPAAYRYWQFPLLISVALGTSCVIGAFLYWILESGAERRFQLDVAAHGVGEFSLREAFRFSRSFWLIVALCVTFYAGIFPFQTFAQKFLLDAKHATSQTAALLVGMLSLCSMVGTPLFGLLVDRVGRRALFMMFGALLLAPVYLVMAYTALPPVVPMAMMAVAFALVPAVIWAAVAYVVVPSRLGFAYGFMDAVQQAGLVGFNLLIGWSNDRYSASAANPAGYRLGMWIFSLVVFAAVVFAVWLRRTETGPGASGLETITIRSQALARLSRSRGEV